MIDMEKERLQMLAFLTKAKKAKDKPSIDFLQRRIDLLDLIEATRTDDDGYRWMLELIVSDTDDSDWHLPTEDDSDWHLSLNAITKDEAVKEATKIIKKEKKRVKRARLYSVHLEKQFRLDEYGIK